MYLLKNRSSKTVSNKILSMTSGRTKKLSRKGSIVSVLISGLFWVSVLLAVVPNALAHSGNLETSSLPVLFNAPEIPELTHWVNSEKIKSMKELRGKVVLVDFWTYSCFNCINTFPYVQSWHEKYAKDGLVVLGIHAPEFQFERNLNNVRQAVKKHGRPLCNRLSKYRSLSLLPWTMVLSCGGPTATGIGRPFT